jgi:regulator of replication initiation timing
VILTENKVPAVPEVSSVMQQVGLLNLRINDMMTQLNTVMKMMINENTALKNENIELKGTQKNTGKP